MSSSMEDALGELFTMKMRCLEYEQRLAQVNLHGATGETLQRQNMEWMERCAEAERRAEECRIAEKLMSEELNGLKNILVKTRKAIISLEASNVSLKNRLSELEPLEEEIKPLRISAVLGLKQMRQLEEARQDVRWCRNKMTQAEQESTSLRTKLDEAERVCKETIKRTQQSADMAKLAQEELAAEKDARAQDAAKLEQRLAESEKQADRRRHEESLAFQGQLRKLELALDTLERQAECKDKEIERLSEENAACRRTADAHLQELATYREDLAQSKALRASAELALKAAQQAGHDADSLRSTLAEERKRAETKQSEHWALLGRKEEELAALESKLKDSKNKSKAREQDLQAKIAQLQEDADKVKSKWMTSLTAKRKIDSLPSKENDPKPRAKTDLKPPKRLSPGVPANARPSFR